MELEIPESFQKLIDFTELFWTLNSENIEEIIQQLGEIIDLKLLNYSNIADMINSFSNRNPKKLHTIISFITLFIAKHPDFTFPENFTFFSPWFQKLLFFYGIIEKPTRYDFQNETKPLHRYSRAEKEAEIEKAYNIFEPKTILYCLLNDDAETLPEVMGDNCNINAMMVNGYPLITLAAKYGSVRCFKYLLLNGATYQSTTFENAFLGNNYEIIHLCEQNCEATPRCSINAILSHHNETARFMLEKYGFDWNYMTTLLTFNFEMFFEKLQSNSDINALDKENNSAIAAASSCYFVEIVKFLLDKGGNPNAVISGLDATAETLLLYATRNNNKDLMKILLEKGADPCLSKTNPLLLCLKNNDIEGVKLFQKKVDLETFIIDDEGKTPLIYAASRGQHKLMKFLIKIGVKTNVLDAHHTSPLMYCVYEEDYKGMKILLDAGADINTLVFGRKSCLFIAIENNDLNLVKFLVEHGADIELEDSNGKTAIFLAADKNKNICKYLVKCGAKLDKLTNDDTSLLITAIEKQNPWLVNKCLESRTNINQRNKKGITPLIAAYKIDDKSTVFKLMDLGADPKLGSDFMRCL